MLRGDYNMQQGYRPSRAFYKSNTALSGSGALFINQGAYLHYFYMQEQQKRSLFIFQTQYLIIAKHAFDLKFLSMSYSSLESNLR